MTHRLTAHEERFLSLLRFALFNTRVPEETFSEHDWEKQIHIAQEQSVIGILYTAIEKLPVEKRPSKKLILSLYATVSSIEEHNTNMNKGICEVFPIYKSFGCTPLLLKGQGVAANYPFPERRMSGDMDILLNDGFDKIHQWVLDNGNKVAFCHPHYDKHQGFFWKNLEIENHFRLAQFYNKRLNKRLQQIISTGLEMEKPLTIHLNGETIELLPPTLGMLHLLVHFSVHLVNWGIGFRQLCDMVMYMNSHYDKINKELLDDWLKQLDLRRISGTVAAIAVTRMGLPMSRIPFTWRRDAVWSDALMAILFASGNFGVKQIRKNGLFKSLLGRFGLFLQQSRQIYSFAPREIRSALAVRCKRKIRCWMRGEWTYRPKYIKE